MLSTMPRPERPMSSSPTQPRALRRDWNRYKPHLSKSTSLPSFQLIPPNRPLFTCLQCGFTNSQIPLCLWCAWTSDEATKEFERSSNICAKRRERRRRISSPARVDYDEMKATCEPTVVPARLQSDNILPEVELPDIATPSASASQSLSLHEGNKKYKRSSKRHGLIAGSHNISPESRPSSIQSRRSTRESQNKIRPVRTRSRLPDLFLAPESTEEPACTTSCSSSNRNAIDLAALTPPLPSSPHPIKSPPPSSTLQQPHAIHAKTPSQNVVVPESSHPLLHSASSLSLSLSQPQRTIRRKKRLTLLKQKSSRSLRTRASAPLLGMNLNSDPVASDGTRSLTPTPAPTPRYIPTPIPTPIPMSTLQPPATVRLGHPSRPYYTAIRPNMSRPSSPFDNSARTSPSMSRAPSPSFSSPHSIPCTSTHVPDALYPANFALPTSRSSYSSYLGANGNATMGFSLSGETELRMALARLRSADGDALREGQPSEYRFRETAVATGNLNVRNKGKRCGNGKLGGKMKRLGMGILELVLGRK